MPLVILRASSDYFGLSSDYRDHYRAKQVKIVPHTVKNPKSATVDNLTEKANREKANRESDVLHAKVKSASSTFYIGYAEQMTGKSHYLRTLGAPAVVVSLALQGVFRGFKDIKIPVIVKQERALVVSALGFE
ncbi:hypothetical protein Tco_0824456 [Tanacetum coccineum]|uniref:Uncharacterized protein n=1 Tax=Tanacetum coccineum TaxID=301880 RepID=A0ABQ5ANG1_9ASTR